MSIKNQAQESIHIVDTYCRFVSNQFWWSRGESNPGPKKVPTQHLQFRQIR